jgi:hypothetical protein
MRALRSGFAFGTHYADEPSGITTFSKTLRGVEQKRSHYNIHLP